MAHPTLDLAWDLGSIGIFIALIGWNENVYARLFWAGFLVQDSYTLKEKYETWKHSRKFSEFDRAIERLDKKETVITNKGLEKE